MAFDRNLLPDPTTYFENQGLILKGPRSAKWKTTTCTFHGGSDSMRINLASGGWCCMSCGAKGGDVLAYHMAAHGLDFIDAAKAMGCWVDDGQPHRPQRPKPLPAGQAIGALSFEATLAAVAAGNIARGVQLTDKDRARLYVCAQRIQTILGAFA